MEEEDERRARARAVRGSDSSNQIRSGGTRARPPVAGIDASRSAPATRLHWFLTRTRCSRVASASWASLVVARLVDCGRERPQGAGRAGAAGRGALTTLGDVVKTREQASNVNRGPRVGSGCWAAITGRFGLQQRTELGCHRETRIGPSNGFPADKIRSRDTTDTARLPPACPVRQLAAVEPTDRGNRARSQTLLSSQLPLPTLRRRRSPERRPARDTLSGPSSLNRARTRGLRRVAAEHSAGCPALCAVSLTRRPKALSRCSTGRDRPRRGLFHSRGY